MPEYDYINHPWRVMDRTSHKLIEDQGDTNLSIIVGFAAMKHAAETNPGTLFSLDVQNRHYHAGWLPIATLIVDKE